MWRDGNIGLGVRKGEREFRSISEGLAKGNFWYPKGAMVSKAPFPDSFRRCFSVSDILPFTPFP
jgi:hypothetical protein